MRRHTEKEVYVLARKEAEKSTSNKCKVGAVLTKKNVINGKVFYEVITSGFNYNPSNDGACEDEQGETYPSVIHAEAASMGKLPYAAKVLLTPDHVMFVTREPCAFCVAAMGAAGITAWHIVPKGLTPPPPTPTPTPTPTPLAEVPKGIARTLKERGDRYGTFASHAIISRGLQRVMTDSANWANLSSDKQEALSMIMHKVGRILNGDPEYKDSWHDIIGYAKLIEDTLED